MADDLGPDIAEVIEELGSTFTIVRTGLTEKVLSNLRELARDPAFQERHFDAVLSYNTAINSGDIIQSGGENFIVMDKSTDDFEDSVVKCNAVLYKCNLPSTTKILIPTETTNETTFAVTVSWSIRLGTVYGLLFPGARGAVLNQENITGKELTYKLMCFVPDFYGVERYDRFYLSASEFYRVEDIEKHQYAGIHVLSLVEDERAVYASNSPSSSPSTSPSSSPSVSP